MDRHLSAQKLPRLGTFRVNSSHREKRKRAGSRALTVRGMCRWVLYRPLALLMAVLLIPSISWFESRAGIPLGSSAKSFQASAQTGGAGCSPASATAIIRNYCVNSQLFNLFGDLSQFESDSVNAYLTMHNLPSSDAHLIYDEGRTDLRNAVRGIMMDDLRAIIATPATQRSAHDQVLYSWLQAAVQQNEITEYTQALAAFTSFQNDTCHFTLDPDVAKQYNLSFDGSLWCFGVLARGFEPPVPDEDYFTAYGIKKSYGATAATFTNFSALVAGTEIGENEALGLTAALASPLALLETISVVQAIIQWSFIVYVAAATAANLSAATSSLPAITSAVVAVAGNAQFTGPVGIIVMCVVAAVVAGIELASDAQKAAWVADLNNKLTQATNSLPDLGAFATDSIGSKKLEMTFVSQTTADVPSTAKLPAHRTGTDPGFNISTSGGATPGVSDTLTYKDWSGATWSAQTWGGWFVQACTSAAGSTCPQADSIIASLNYVDWSGVNWTASRSGNIFTSTKAVPASTDTACPADATGVSPGTDFSTCKSYASTTIPVTDNQGNQIVVGISTFSPPNFTNPPTSSAGSGAGKSVPLVFSPGTASTVTITAAGNPTPSVCLSSGSLTSDFTLNGGGNSCGTGSYTLAFDGASNAAQQVYPLTFTAANSFGTVSQSFLVDVATQLNIISPAILNVTAGLPVNFTVVTTGNPTPTLSSNEFPALGLNFKDNGNGTATISGVVPFPESTFCVNPCSIGVTATNTQGTVTQYLKVNAGSPPLANLLPPTSATFTAGISNAVLLASSGAITPVTWGYQQDPTAPTPWLSLKDNGDGTAWLTGTPPVGTSGTFNPSIGPGAEATLEIINPFPVTVIDTPVFTSPSTTSFSVGTPSSFTASATQGTISLVTGILPNGLSISSGSITGTPAPNTGGQYLITLNDNAGSAGSTSQTVILDVDEGPQITSPSSAVFFTGKPGYFAVTTTGYPSLSTQPVSQDSAPPTSPDQGEGMFFTVTGLPADLQFSNLNDVGLATGTLTIQGTPSAADAGLHPVTITAQNGVGTPTQQTLMLSIITITGAAPASGTTCNGNYNGAFTGTVTVSAGQNCSFVDGGGVTGNVTVRGGSLELANAKVTGNVSVHGASAFSFGEGSEVTGHLDIHEVASGSTTNRICGAKLDGNVLVAKNATPIQIGSLSDSSCIGNLFGGDVQIHGNTAAVTVYNNTVKETLSCAGNTAITGGGNAAQQERGQCAHF